MLSRMERGTSTLTRWFVLLLRHFFSVICLAKFGLATASCGFRGVRLFTWEDC